MNLAHRDVHRLYERVNENDAVVYKGFRDVNKVRLLEFIMHLCFIDGVIEESERLFINAAMRHLQFTDEERAELKKKVALSTSIV